MCAHGGQAQPTTPYPRVLMSGQPAVQVAPPWVVAGCAMPPPIAGNGPCVTATFTTGTTRVMGSSMPLLTQASQAQCVPTGTPALVAVTQVRVQAT
jgi:hypothetical protein